MIEFPRGTLKDGETVITLMEKADRSTFLHESGHFFLEVFQEIAASGGAPRDIQTDMAAIHDFLGSQPGEGFTVSQQEKWARAFETYLMEGKAPSSRLAVYQPLFANPASDPLKSYDARAAWVPQGVLTDADPDIGALIGAYVYASDVYSDPRSAAPVISNATAEVNGSSGYNVSVDTNKAGGRLGMVLTTEATQPSAQQILAGVNHVDAPAAMEGGVWIDGAGTVAFSGSGLPQDVTFFAHFAWLDTTGTFSNVATSSRFTTGATGADLTVYNAPISGTAPTLVLDADSGLYAAGATLEEASPNNLLTTGQLELHSFLTPAAIAEMGGDETWILEYTPSADDAGSVAYILQAVDSVIGAQNRIDVFSDTDDLIDFQLRIANGPLLNRINNPGVVIGERNRIALRIGINAGGISINGQDAVSDASVAEVADYDTFAFGRSISSLSAAGLQAFHKFIRYPGALSDAELAALSYITAPIATDKNLSYINADGWRGLYSNIPAQFDPTGDPKYAVVTRQGFDSVASATTVDDQLLITQRTRTPGEATLTSDGIALQDYVYSTDTIAGVTNNSLRIAPKPIAQWLNRDRERAESSTYTVRLFVAHMHARNGLPVAGVRFVANDGANTVQSDITTLSNIAYSASGFTVPHYATDIDLSTLNEGAVTIDAIVYPWVGTPFQISVDANTYPSPNLTTLRVWNDRAGSYSKLFAYVDAVSGSNGTGVTSTNASTAQAAPYATIKGAIDDLTAANPEPGLSGCIVRLEAGTHGGYGGNVNHAFNGDIPLIIEAANPANRSTTILRPPGGTENDFRPGFVMRDITIDYDTNNRLWDGNATFDVAFERVVFTGNGAPSVIANVPGRVEFHDCQSTADIAYSPFNFLNTGYAHKIIGCDFSFASNKDLKAFSVIGSRLKNAAMSEVLLVSSQVKPVGRVLAYNHCSIEDGFLVFAFSGELPSTERGIAIVGNVFERFGGTFGSGTLSSLGLGSSATGTVENAVIQHNTFVGSKNNWAYQDLSTVDTTREISLRNNIFHELNHKGDGNGDNSLSGNWPTRFGVGAHYNTLPTGDSDQNVEAWNSFTYELLPPTVEWGTNEAPIETDFANPKYAGETDPSGNGDYTPGQTNALVRIPAEELCYPTDMLGRIMPTDDTAVVGALQEAS
ncbi:MAG: hypothetical protein AAGE61_11490 [Pseudomonadota bacterium]